MIDYTYNNNKNLDYLRNRISNVYLFFESKNVHKNLDKLFNQSIGIGTNKTHIQSFAQEDFGSLLGAAELIFKGWHKEAIPFSIKKKSIISGFFERFF